MKNWMLLAILLLFGFNLSANDRYWMSEAEDGILIGDPEVNTACAYASGGKFVKLAGQNGKGIEFDNVSVSKAGTYQMNIDYFYVNTSYLEVFVNGSSKGSTEFPTAIWCYQGAPATHSINVNLNQGINSIKLMVFQGKSSPLIDKVEVMDPTKNILSIYSEKEFLFPGDSCKLTIETDKVVEEDIEVSLNVGGLETNQYALTESVNIIKGAKLVDAYFKVQEDGLIKNKTALIQISSTNQNIQIGENDHVEINIIVERTNYYVSSSSGDDSNDGLSPETAWETLEKVSDSKFFPGDSILFKSGDEFIGQIVTSSSGTKNKPIVYSSYGEGDKPLIDGGRAEGGPHLTSIFINNHECIYIEKLEITNNRLSSRDGVSDNLAHGIYVLNNGNKVMNHFVFKHLTIRDIFAVTIEGVEFNNIKVGAIYLKSEANAEAGKEKNINDVLVDSCFFARSSRYGIFSGHGSGAEGVGNDSINRNSNFVFRNNHFLDMGGSCITPGRTYNCLVENNIFENPGSGEYPRMANRGSGAWFWNCRNVLAQYNKIYHVRGYGDSYCMHVDFGNENVFFQYNYSEDTEGGFVEILGKNINSCYRFNVSVNDGFRDNHGNSIWISDYAGKNVKITSDKNYIYNNTIYVDANITPDILITGQNTYIYNNIFYATGNGRIADEVTVNIDNGSQLFMSNNLFFGNVSTQLSSIDDNPIYGNPFFESAGALNSEGYMLKEASTALKAGKSFEEPLFPMAGKGIFKNVSARATSDLYGNPVDMVATAPNIGAFNGDTGLGFTEMVKGEIDWSIFPNPVKGDLNIMINSDCKQVMDFKILDVSGREILLHKKRVEIGENKINIQLPENSLNGIYFVQCNWENKKINSRFILYRK